VSPPPRGMVVEKSGDGPRKMVRVVGNNDSNSTKKKVKL